MVDRLRIGIVVPLLFCFLSFSAKADKYYFANDFYYFQGQKIALHRSTTRCVVKFHAWVSKADLTSPFARVPESLAMEKELEFQGERFAILNLQAAKATSAQKAQAQGSSRIEETIAQLATVPEVEFVSPLFFDPKTKTHLFPTGKIVVKLKPGQKIEELLEHYASWKIKVEEKIYAADDEYVLKANLPVIS
ncbi:hypothetical protein JCM13664_10730 [Methylothermus subterraneus]